MNIISVDRYNHILCRADLLLMTESTEHSERAMDSLPDDILSALLMDRTTGAPIRDAEPMTVERARALLPRCMKPHDERSSRQDNYAEVFTPLWMVRIMTDEVDPVCDDWQSYVCVRVLEPTCGEAPFLTTRYDPSLSLSQHSCERVGMLDRKLSAIPPCPDRTEWCLRALQSCHGCELNADSLLLARVNVLLTFIDACAPSHDAIMRACDIITWNLWQMDMYTLSPPHAPVMKPTLDNYADGRKGPMNRKCRLMDWNTGSPYAIDKGRWDVAACNPPYNIIRNGAYRSIFPDIMDAIHAMCDKAVTVVPARPFYDAGNTSVAWRRKALSDPHMRIIWSDPSERVFADAEVTGGVAIVIRDAHADIGPIGMLCPTPAVKALYDRMTEVMEHTEPVSAMMRKGVRMHDGHIGTKVPDRCPDIFRMEPRAGDVVIFGRTGGCGGHRMAWCIDRDLLDADDGWLYGWKLFIPEAFGKGAIGDTIPYAFISCGCPKGATPNYEGDGMGNSAGNSAGDGAGRYVPAVGVHCATESFLQLGPFTEDDARAMLGYVSTRFFRTCMSLLKRTQHANAKVYGLVPTPDGEAMELLKTMHGDELDRALCRLYGLDDMMTDMVMSCPAMAVEGNTIVKV